MKPKDAKKFFKGRRVQAIAIFVIALFGLGIIGPPREPELWHLHQESGPIVPTTVSLLVASGNTRSVTSSITLPVGWNLTFDTPADTWLTVQADPVDLDQSHIERGNFEFHSPYRRGSLVDSGAASSGPTGLLRVLAKTSQQS